MQYQVPGQLLQIIINYLQTKPFNEVNEILVALNNTAKKIEQPAPKEAKGAKEDKSAENKGRDNKTDAKK